MDPCGTERWGLQWRRTSCRGQLGGAKRLQLEKVRKMMGVEGRKEEAAEMKQDP